MLNSNYCQRAFDTLKDQLTAIPFLTFPDLSKSMILYTDASYQCAGAVLNQPCPHKEKPVPGIQDELPMYIMPYWFSATQQRWLETELSVIVSGLQKLDYYTNGVMFTIKTEHKPPQYMLEDK